MRTQIRTGSVFLILMLVGLFGGAATSLAGISTTKHNLSASGTGSIKATTESQLCVYCHAPHNTNPAVSLWNHGLSAATYTPYSSRTLAAGTLGQPTGASKLCLTCHDGTVAIGDVQNRPYGTGTGVITGLTAVLLGSSINTLGTDLRNDHPVSFNYNAALAAINPELVAPAALTGKIKPDGNGVLQCTSCHDPHSDTNPKFLHAGYKDGSGYGSPLCKTCHAKQYWDSVPNNAHRESTKQWNGAGTNPWHLDGQNLPNNANSTPKTNGCENCHDAHGSSNEHLLKSTTGSPSEICLRCHNGNVATPSQRIDTHLAKTSHHPVLDPARIGRHKSKRQVDGKVREDQADLGNRHAECVDCHNPHAMSAGTTPDVSTTVNQTTNLAPKVLKGVWGVEPLWGANWTDLPQNGGYTVVDDVQYTYQLCMKCHSSYAFGTTPPANANMVGGFQTDQAKEFNPNNKSIHPITGVGKNTFKFTRGATVYDYSSSLIVGGTAPAQTITIGCIECHSNKDPLTGEAGPKGPHGSNVWPILWAPYNQTTGMSTTSGHLCFKCHSFTTYASETTKDNWRITGFSDGSKNLHSYHVSRKDVPCTGCHVAVPHGYKNKHLWVFGVSNSRSTPDPAPYNNHSVVKLDGSNNYGLPSNMGADRGKTPDTIASGNWIKDDCHGSLTDTGSCK